MSVRYVSLERVHGLKALRRSSTADASAPGFEGSWLNDARDLPFRPKTIPYDPARLSEALGATPKTNEYGDYLSVRSWCAQPPEYSPDLRALRLLLPEAPDEIAGAEHWLFLDTETTGLAGGSGTYAFLVGIAWWEDGGLEIEQFFLREQSEERALLFALRERIAERPVLVTFNGKSFDWPLLETRYRMSRKISAPTPKATSISCTRHGTYGGCVLGPYGCLNSNATCWVGTGERTCSPGRFRKSTSISCADFHPNGSFLSSTTTRWTCVGWRRCPVAFFLC